MTQNTSIIEPQDSKHGPEGRLQPHVRQFLAISREIEDAVQKGNQADIAAAQRKLEEFHATLTRDQQSELVELINKIQCGQDIEHQRKGFHRKLARMFHIVGATAEPIARFTGETMYLIMLTFGLVVGGIVMGARNAYKAVLQKAA